MASTSSPASCVSTASTSSPTSSPLLPLAARRVTRRSQSANTMHTSFEIRKVRIASTRLIGYQDDGVCEEEEEAGMVEDSVVLTHRLPDFFGPQHCFQGFQYIPYHGPTSRPIMDTAQKVCAVFGGMPDDPNFMCNVHDPAVAAIEAALRDCCVSEECCSHRCGNFPQLTEGDSMGGGQKQPGALVNGAENTHILNRLTALPAFIRLAGFATGDSANWAPWLFDFYVI
ncbi:hypothetical protein B0H14DRAFT_2657717 [Mycena olivaceomarginata]|nr:hypothetical protein B0H14DRAFT_2657717 [Mycena olivaceomarginata]